MAAEVEIVLKAVDDGASAVLNDVGSKLGAFGAIAVDVAASIATIAFDALAAGAAALGAAFTFSIKEASDAELAVARLNGVLIATGGAVGLTSEQLQNMAGRLQDVTRFSDETIMGGEAILLTFRNIGAEMYERTVPAMVSMAEIFGSVDSAAMQLGKALNDPVAGMGALSRAGITFSAEQKEMIKNFVEMGDVASAQNIILSEVEAQVGGLAEVMGNTFAGQITIAKNHLSDFAEVIGGPFISVFTDMLEKFNDFAVNSPIINNIKDFFTNLKDLIDANVPPVAALGATFLQFSQLSPIFNEIGTGLLLMQGYLTGGDNPLVALKKAIDDLQWAHPGGPLYDILTYIQDFINTGQTAGWGKAIGDVFSDILTGLDLKGKLQTSITSLGNLIAVVDWTNVTVTLANVIQKALTMAFAGFANVLSVIVEQTDWTPLGEALKSMFSEIWSGIANNVVPNLFGEDTAEQWGIDMRAGLLYTLGGIGEFLYNAIVGTFDWVAGAQDWAASIANGLISGFKNLLGIASPSKVFMEFGRSIVEGLIAGWDATIGLFITAISTTLTDIGNLFGIDLSGILGGGGSSASGLGTAGGGVATTGGTGGGSTSGTVINIYGPSYWGVSGPGDVGGVYDCPSPNPLVAASANQLVTTGF